MIGGFYLVSPKTKQFGERSVRVLVILYQQNSSLLDAIGGERGRSDCAPILLVAEVM